jgi:tetratricopeptide (TPR) repeat protein
LGRRIAAWCGHGLTGLLIVAGMAVSVQAATPEAYRLNEAAIAEAQRGNHEAAIALLVRALRLDAGDEAIRKNLAGQRTVLGHRLLRSGQAQRAEEEYRAALELDASEVSALLGLGEVQLQRRDPRAAAETCRRALRIEPSNVNALICLGQAYYNQDDLTGALAEWHRALTLRPNDATLIASIARAEREARVQAGYRARDSQHFTVAYEGRRQDDIGEALVRVLERAYVDVGYALGAYPDYAVPTIFYPDQDFVAATGMTPDVGGFYHRMDGKIRIAVKGLKPGDPGLRAVAYHEYTHALIFAISRGNNPPRWIHEGLAVHMEDLRAPAFKEEAIRRQRAGRRETLDGSPYVMGSVAVGYLIERHGMGSLRTLLTRLGAGRPFREAFQETFQTDLATFEQAVRDVVIRGY